MSWQEAHRPSAWGRFRVLGLPEHLILFTFTLSFSEGCQPGLCPHCVSLHRQRLPYQGSSHLGTVLHQEVWHPPTPPSCRTFSENVQGEGSVSVGWRACDELDEERQWMVS